MKKIIYILSIISLFVACSKGFDTPQTVENDLDGNEMVELDFSVPYEMPTKADMGLVPKIDPASSTMHVLVFNAKTGALIQVAKAELTGTIDARGEGNKAQYKVLVKLGSTARYLQFIVDAPNYTPAEDDEDDTGLGYAATDNTEAVKVILGDSEATVASKLYTKEGKTAYWQRVSLPNGIQPYVYTGGVNKYNSEYKEEDGSDVSATTRAYIDANGNTVNVDDYTDANGNKIVNNTGYIASQDVQNRTAVIPLIRNFLTITLTSKNADITLLQAGLVNHPRGGYIAPFNRSNNSFVAGYSASALTHETLKSEDIKSSGYTAPFPSIIVKEEDEDGKVVDVDKSLYTKFSDVKYTEATDGQITLFSYERGVPESKPLALLLQVNMPVSTGGKANKWLKIDLMDDKGNYLGLFRDFLYPFKLNSITGSDGYDTAKEAFEKPSIGDISSSPETQNLTQISDGKGLNLWVDYTDYTHVGPANTTGVNLRYKFWYVDENNTTTILSDKVDLDLSHSQDTPAVTNNPDRDSYSGTDTQDGQSGWYYTNVKLAASPNSGIIKSTIRVSGTYQGKTLYKDVTFNVRAVDNLTLKGTRNGSNVTLEITLPQNLGYSVFPLTLSIEDYNNNINPTDGTPVATGESLFNGVTGTYHKTGNSFYFQKLVNFSDYNATTGTTITVPFTKTVANTATVFVVKDNKGIFNLTSPLAVN